MEKANCLGASGVWPILSTLANTLFGQLSARPSVRRWIRKFDPRSFCRGTAADFPTTPRLDVTRTFNPPSRETWSQFSMHQDLKFLGWTTSWAIPRFWFLSTEL